MKKVLERKQITITPVGKEEPVQKTGNFCLSKTPAGVFILGEIYG
jgi:hypothetical protein